MRRWLLTIGRVIIIGSLVLAAIWASGLGMPARVERLVFGPKMPVVVGLLHSQTGPLAINERSLQDAEIMALEEINARGGVAGRRVAWVAKDARSDSAAAAGLARSLIQEDKASAIFGCWTSDGRKAVQAVIEEKGGLLVFPANYEGMEHSTRTIYTGGTANQSIVPAVRWCFDALKARRFFVVGTEEIWSRSVAEIGKDTARASGGEVIGESYFGLAGGGEDAAVEVIRAARPDVVLNMIVGESNLTFLAAMRRAGLTPEKLPSMCFGFAEDELKRFPPGDVAGHYAGMAYFQSLIRPESRDFVRRFKARYGEDRAISDPMVAAYNGVILWGRAVADSGSIDPSMVLAHLNRQSQDAPEGVITVDPSSRVAWRPFHVGRARRDGQFDVVYSIVRPIRPSRYVATRTLGQWRAMLDGLRAGWGGRWSAPASPDQGAAARRPEDQARPG